jgi:hypothetical protein
MEGGGALLSHSNIPLSVCQTGPTHTWDLRVHRSVLEQWGGKYAQRNKNAWPGLELKTSWLWYQLRETPLANLTIKPRWYGRGCSPLKPFQHFQLESIVCSNGEARENRGALSWVVGLFAYFLDFLACWVHLDALILLIWGALWWNWRL